MLLVLLPRNQKNRKQQCRSVYLGYMYRTVYPVCTCIDGLRSRWFLQEPMVRLLLLRRSATFTASRMARQTRYCSHDSRIFFCNIIGNVTPDKPRILFNVRMGFSLQLCRKFKTPYKANTYYSLRSLVFCSILFRGYFSGLTNLGIYSLGCFHSCFIYFILRKTWNLVLQKKGLKLLLFYWHRSLASLYAYIFGLG